MVSRTVRLPASLDSALVVCPRRIGDVLLATPLVHSLKRAFPTAAIDMLVFEGTEGVVSTNPEIRKVVTVPQRPGLAEHLALYTHMWRRYDLAVSAQASDRSTLYARVAGRVSVGMVVDDQKSWWKRRLLTAWVPFDNLQTHTVAMNLRLLDLLGIAPHATPVVAWSRQDEEAVAGMLREQVRAGGYAVLHVSPKYAYKQWTASGWVALAEWLVARGLQVAVAAGDSDQERMFVSELLRRLPSGSIDLAGKLGLSALGCVISRAALYVGTDTAVSHMAAALGVPSVVLFGPSNPVKWGPWPKGHSDTSRSPWKTHGTQRSGNVLLVQGIGDCVPCLGEGCDRHEQSLSQCLQQMPPAVVIEAVEVMLKADRSAIGVSR